MSKTEMRKEFEAYYADLVMDGRVDGVFFDKQEQWEWFKENKVDPQD